MHKHHIVGSIQIVTSVVESVHRQYDFALIRRTFIFEMIFAFHFFTFKFIHYNGKIIMLWFLSKPFV